MSVKSERLASQIQRELGSILLNEVKDHKIGFITITAVEVTNDLSIAKVYYTVLGKDARVDAAAKAIDRAKGFIRSELARRLTTRKAPELRFVHDTSREYGNKIDSIISEINKTEE